MSIDRRAKLLGKFRGTVTTARCIRKASTGARGPAAGAYEVILVLYASNGSKLMGPLGFAVCEECRHDSTVAGLVSDDDWGRIAGSFIGKGMEPPNRRRSTLAFRQLNAVQESAKV